MASHITAYDHTATPPRAVNLPAEITTADGWRGSLNPANLPAHGVYADGGDDTSSIPGGHVGIAWERVIQDNKSVRIPTASEPADAAENRRLDALQRLAEVVWRLLGKAGYTEFPATTAAALADAEARIGEATIEQTQAGILLSKARDEFVQHGAWSDVKTIADREGWTL